MKQNSLLDHFQQLMFHTFPSDEFNYKNGNGRQNHSSGAKTGLQRRAVAGVVCYMYRKQIKLHNNLKQ